MQLIKDTAKNPFGRFEDGRPQVPDEYLNAVKSAPSEMLFGTAAKRRTRGNSQVRRLELLDRGNPAQGLLYWPMKVKVDLGLLVSVMVLNTLNN